MTTTSYVIVTPSCNWLIESAESESDALEQYYTGDAEPHVNVRAPRDEEEIEFLRHAGQYS
jgi:hypothetical protein